MRNYEFSGTPEDSMSSMLNSLEHAVGDGPNESAYFRHALLGLIGLRHARVTSGSVSAERMQEFRARSLQYLLGQRSRIALYLNRTLDIAETAIDSEWSELCVRRSILQFLLDDYAGTPVADWIDLDVLAELDVEMQRVGDDQGPLEPAWIPRGMPASHWWWRYLEHEDSSEPTKTPES